MAIDALTDPDEIALYQQYGPNWRRVIGSGMRDRGGRYDRNMRFNHGVPTGFLTRPVAPQAFNPAPSIDTGAYEKYRQEYNRLMAEYNNLLNQYNDFNSQQNNSYQNTAYDQQQQYYQDNYNAAYGQNNETSSQTNQYTGPMEFLSSPSSSNLMGFAPQMNIGGDVMAGGSMQGLTSGSSKNPLSQVDLTFRPIMSNSYNHTYMTNPAATLASAGPIRSTTPYPSAMGAPQGVGGSLPPQPAKSGVADFSWGNIANNLTGGSGRQPIVSSPEPAFSWSNVAKNLGIGGSTVSNAPTVNTVRPTGPAPVAPKDNFLRGSKASSNKGNVGRK